ncbi:hypothetical protein K438DRAFT_1939042 [Mycena galopus ATCC 62051]|nr:hypothetical protein K438DRAFT_1939042 [Mycena galopus ATCC 62051]
MQTFSLVLDDASLLWVVVYLFLSSTPALSHKYYSCFGEFSCPLSSPSSVFMKTFRLVFRPSQQQPRSTGRITITSRSAHTAGRKEARDGFKDRFSLSLYSSDGRMDVCGRCPCGDAPAGEGSPVMFMKGEMCAKRHAAITTRGHAFTDNSETRRVARDGVLQSRLDSGVPETCIAEGSGMPQGNEHAPASSTITTVPSSPFLSQSCGVTGRIRKDCARAAAECKGEMVVVVWQAARMPPLSPSREGGPRVRCLRRHPCSEGRAGTCLCRWTCGGCVRRRTCKAAGAGMRVRRCACGKGRAATSVQGHEHREVCTAAFLRGCVCEDGRAGISLRGDVHTGRCVLCADIPAGRCGDVRAPMAHLHPTTASPPHTQHPRAEMHAGRQMRAGRCLQAGVRREIRAATSMRGFTCCPIRAARSVRGDTCQDACAGEYMQTLRGKHGRCSWGGVRAGCVCACGGSGVPAGLCPPGKYALARMSGSSQSACGGVHAWICAAMSVLACVAMDGWRPARAEVDAEKSPGVYAGGALRAGNCAQGSAYGDVRGGRGKRGRARGMHHELSVVDRLYNHFLVATNYIPAFDIRYACPSHSSTSVVDAAIAGILGRY